MLMSHLLIGSFCVTEECQGLAKDLGYLTKEIPFKIIGQQLAERGCRREDLDLR